MSSRSQGEWKGLPQRTKEKYIAMVDAVATGLAEDVHLHEVYDEFGILTPTDSERRMVREIARLRKLKVWDSLSIRASNDVYLAIEYYEGELPMYKFENIALVAGRDTVIRPVKDL